MAPRVCPAVCEHHPWCRVDCLVHDIGGNAPRCAGRELGTTQVGLAGGISRGFSVLNSDNLLCSTWAQVRNESVRKGRQMSAADAWIAATALVLSAPVVTNNAKDYRHLGNLQLVSAAG